MAIARMTTAENHAVSASLKRAQNKNRIDSAGTRHTNNFYIGRIIQPIRARKVGARIGTPVAAERDDFRFELAYRHIASTSAIIC